MSDLDAVVTGTGRCGTRWVSRLLNAAGVATGHEAAFMPRGYRPNKRIRVDVSWLAMTAEHSFSMFWLVRHPQTCIASLIDSRVFSRDESDPYARAIMVTLPGGLTGDALTDACRWYAWVNGQTLRPIRVEETRALAPLWAHLRVPADRIRSAIRQTPRDTHRLGPRTTRLAWHDLTPEAQRIAEGLGYEPLRAPRSGVCRAPAGLTGGQ